MNIGERIKQIRAEKNLTQPQLAEMIGIEQSYLSKLENDKSIPSADIFQSLLKGLEMTSAEFLQEIDKDSMHKQLKHIPEVANHLAAQTTIKVHSVKKWLYLSTALCILGLTLIVASYRGLIFGNTIYQYESTGVTKPEEPLNIFLERHVLSIFLFKTQIHYLSKEQWAQLEAFEIERKNLKIELKDHYLGKTYIEKVDGGFRSFYLTHQQIDDRVENRWLMLTGFFLTFCGIFGFITEYRLRKLQV
jgi:transcriptional regulator with XRE-family HTH domain